MNYQVISRSIFSSLCRIRLELVALTCVVLFGYSALTAQTSSSIPELLSELKTSTSDTALADVLARLCFNYIKLDSDSARIYGQRALSFSNKIAFQKGIGDAHNNLGWLYAEQGKIDSSQFHLDKALQIFEQMKVPAYLAVTRSNLGWLAQKKGNLPESLKQFKMGLEQSEKAKDKASKSILLYSIGATYNRMDEKEKAREYFLQSLESEKELGRKGKQANCLLSIGNSYSHEDSRELAQIFYTKALGLFEQEEDLAGAGLVYENLGNMYLEADPAKALSYYELALDRYKTATRDEDLAYVMLGLGTVNMTLNQYETAEGYLNEGRAISKQLGLSNLEIDYEWNLAELAVKAGQSEKAIAHYQKHSQLKDSMQQVASAEELMRVRGQFETEQAEQENKLLKAENLLRIESEARLKNRWLMTLLAVIALALLTLLAARTLYLKNKHTREVEAFNAELAAQRDHVSQINDLLELKVVRTQLNPHFIFNSQATALALVSSGDVKGATAYLQGISQLIRTILEQSVKDEISIEEEVDFLKQYVQLESHRLKDLHFKIKADESLLEEEASLPSMLVQPFVENAIQHGLLNKQGKQELSIRFREKDGKLMCLIKDNGTGRVAHKHTVGKT